jgi:hypothetical protein
MRTEKKNLIISCIMLAIAFISVISSIFAWFVANDDSNASNIRVDTSNENLHLRDLIEIKRFYKGVLQSDYFFKRENNTDYYYRYDTTNNQFVLDEENKKIGMDVTSIYPNEYVDVTIWYNIDQELVDKDYKIILTNFDDSNGKFNIKNAETNELFEHSALGIFKVGEVIDNTFSNASYLLDYNGDYLSDTVYNEVSVKRSNFSRENTEMISSINYYKTTFRIQLDLTNYNEKLPHASTNALSELYVIIGKISIVC